MSRLQRAKEAFLENQKLINIENLKVLEHLKKRFKEERSLNSIFFIYGQSGVGKSTILRELKEELKERAILFQSPNLEVLDIVEKLNELYKIEAKTPNSAIDSIDKIARDDIVIIFDELLAIDSEILNFIKVLADRASIVCSSLDNSLLSDESFKSRVLESFKVENLNRALVDKYIESRLLNHSLIDIAKIFTKRNYNLIYRLTLGNLREINRLLYRVFEINQAYESEDIMKLNSKTLSNKIIEMSAIDLGILNG